MTDDLRSGTHGPIPGGGDDEPRNGETAPIAGAAGDAARAERATRAAGVDPLAAIPARVGRYRILRLIGEGGMGIVYEAEQEKPHRAVALKVIKPGVATLERMRRFEKEADVLARLQHPGIAQIFEAGTADAGQGPQPYFAMEMIRGRTLTEHARAAHLDVRARLALLAKICDAVEHAHAHGVIHRDLKPANILVDEHGQPKILDFGVARATDSDVQATMLTDAGQIVGTLPYMSPEQVAADPAGIDARSDVYALGVVLYELLADRLPYDVHRKMIHEAVRVIREEEPTVLSAIARGLRGDVETIVGKALEKDRSRRYQSAADLGSDIRRHLADEPIVARPASAAYQLRKFAKRNKALVAGVAAAFVALALGAAVSLWQAVRATRAAETARKEAAKAVAVNEFLDEMLRAASPKNARGREVTVREAVDAAAKKVDGGSLASQPDVEAAVRQTLGGTYFDLGLYPEAEAQARAAVAIRRRTLGPAHEDLAVSIGALATACWRQGKMTEAESLDLEVLEICKVIGGENSAEYALALHERASLIGEQGRLDEADSLLRRGLEILRGLHGEENLDVAESEHELGVTLAGKGEYDEGATLIQAALATRRRLLGNDAIEVGVALGNLALIAKKKGNLAAADSGYREAIAIYTKAYPEGHANLASAMGNRGVLLDAMGESAAAESLLLETLALQRKILDPDHEDIGSTLSKIGSIQRDHGRPIEAEANHREALRILRARLEPGDVRIAYALDRLGADLLSEAPPKAAEAESALREALAIKSDALPEGHVSIAYSALALGAALSRLRRFAEAESLLLTATDGMIARADEAGPKRIAQARAHLIALYDAWGKPERAAEWRRRAAEADSAQAQEASPAR